MHARPFSGLQKTFDVAAVLAALKLSFALFFFSFFILNLKFVVWIREVNGRLQPACNSAKCS